MKIGLNNVEFHIWMEIELQMLQRRCYWLKLSFAYDRRSEEHIP